MIEVKQLEYLEMPQGVEEFFLVRQNEEGLIIMEWYQKYDEEWFSNLIHNFTNRTPYDETKVLEEVELSVPGVTTLFVEEGTFY